jgi:hypothetical protein
MAQLVKQVGRQCPISAQLNITGAATAPTFPAAGLTVVPADSGVSINTLELPVGAVIQSAQLITDTAFNAGATDTLSVGDAGSATRYFSASSIHATGIANFTTTGLKLDATNNTIKVVWTGGTPASLTTGAARLIVNYVVDGRSEFTQG